ncbi:MAG: hypothetical protein K2Z80_10665 [Xanthobacteraceae bacterium]|nr:hypothetical protein [Xanthobacteraceae bacterium]
MLSGNGFAPGMGKRFAAACRPWNFCLELPQRRGDPVRDGGLPKIRAIGRRCATVRLARRAHHRTVFGAAEYTALSDDSDIVRGRAGLRVAF